MIKKLSLLLAVCLLLVQAGRAQKIEKSLLWQVSGNGLTSPSYLFGTYHLVGKSFADSLPNVKQCFNKCSAVAGEFVIDPSAYAKMVPAMMLTGNSLDKIFTPAEYKMIGDYVQEKLHMDIANLKSLKPAALEVVIMAATAPKTIRRQTQR